MFPEADPVAASLDAAGDLIGFAGKGLVKTGAQCERVPKKFPKDYLDKQYPRVKPRKGLAEKVWERSKSRDGKVYDPSGQEIKPGEYWELGHKPGHKLPDAQQRAAEEGWDRGTWRDYQNDPDIYRPELRRTNGGHEHEATY